MKHLLKRFVKPEKSAEANTSQKLINLNLQDAANLTSAEKVQDALLQKT